MLPLQAHSFTLFDGLPTLECACGGVISIPSCQSVGPGSNPNPGSRHAAHPAVHPPLQAGQ